MPAQIGWIDFSPADHARVKTILSLLRPEGRIDELGIGTIRDGMSDILFPGLSTIQTRAKYFFLVPYLISKYASLPKKKRGKRSVKDSMKNLENELVWELAEKYRGSEENGVIGISKKRGDPLVRLPSEIYWSGISTFGLIDNQGQSYAAYLKSVQKELLKKPERLTDDNEMDDADAGYENILHLKVPIQNDWDENINIDLTSQEAEFLKDAMMDKIGSLFSVLLKDDHINNIFNLSNNYVQFVSNVAEDLFDESVKKVLIQAHDFAILIEGAHIIYNVALQRKFHPSHSYNIEEVWNTWYSKFKVEMIDYKNFDIEEIMAYSHTTKPNTRSFIIAWWEKMQIDNIKIQELIDIVTTQEHDVKKHKARLIKKTAEDVKPGVRIGLSMLNYRYLVAKNIINDITKMTTHA